MTDPAPNESRLYSRWHDGRSAKARAVLVWVQGSDLVLQDLDTGELHRHALNRIRWPERTAHGQRQAELPDGGMLQHADAAQWDAWWQASGQRDAAVVRWQQSWRATGWAVLGSVLFLAMAWVWGVPWLSHGVVQLIPARLEARLGEVAMAQMQELFLKPSQVPVQQQAEIRQRFDDVVAQARQGQETAPYTIQFHHAPALGANAFALPGGQVVLTDDLLAMLADQPDAIQGILAHELGHVQHRDGLHMLVRASLIGAVVGVVFGDAGGFIATVPVVLVQQSYSRDTERRADAFAAQTLADAGLSPAVMAVFFERLGAQSDAAQSRLPIAIASHPDSAERIAFFKNFGR